jgi:hypothetical protein
VNDGTAVSAGSTAVIVKSPSKWPAEQSKLDSHRNVKVEKSRGSPLASVKRTSTYGGW